MNLVNNHESLIDGACQVTNLLILYRRDLVMIVPQICTDSRSRIASRGRSIFQLIARG
jgi:hypothetical protein